MLMNEVWPVPLPFRSCLEDSGRMRRTLVPAPSVYHRPEGRCHASRLVFALPWHARDRSPEHTETGRAMRQLGREARLQGLSPLESPLPPDGGLDHLEPDALLGFQSSSGLSPASPWADATTGPPLTGLARDLAPEGARSRRGHSGSDCGLPLRVSISEEAVRSLARSACPLEVSGLVVRPRNSEAGCPWLMVSPWTPEYIAAS
jgi:hypothetical protein